MFSIILGDAQTDESIDADKIGVIIIYGALYASDFSNKRSIDIILSPYSSARDPSICRIGLKLIWW